MSSNTIMQLHKGNSNIWNTPWCEVRGTIHSTLNLPVTVQPLPLTVNQLWNHLTQTWNIDLINQFFSPHAAHIISNIDVIPSHEKDILIWVPAPNGLCSAKNAFSFLNTASQVQLPAQGARCVSPETMLIMKRIWKLKMCPPVLKTFAWRLIRRALASGKRAGTYSNNISQACSDCNSVEIDAHLFFFYNLPNAVWLSAETPINTSSLPHEDDGIQNILSTIITPQTNDDHLIKILNILWYLWKARNDKRFNNKCWTTRQLHHVANADFTIAQSVLQEHDHSLNDEQGDNGEQAAHESSRHNPINTDLQFFNAQVEFSNRIIEPYRKGTDKMINRDKSSISPINRG
jgi:hypothetical protein